MHIVTHWLLDGWKPNEWMWYFPQFHEIIFGMTALAILLLIGIFIMTILILWTNRKTAKAQQEMVSLLKEGYPKK